jgi:hypothetical protein
MTIHEVSTHIGGMADDVLTRIRPATNLLVDAARMSSEYVEGLLRPSLGEAAEPTTGVVIVSRDLTRC